MTGEQAVTSSEKCSTTRSARCALNASSHACAMATARAGVTVGTPIGTDRARDRSSEPDPGAFEGPTLVVGGREWRSPVSDSGGRGHRLRRCVAGVARRRMGCPRRREPPPVSVSAVPVVERDGGTEHAVRARPRRRLPDRRGRRGHRPSPRDRSGSHPRHRSPRAAQPRSARSSRSGAGGMCRAARASWLPPVVDRGFLWCPGGQSPRRAPVGPFRPIRVRRSAPPRT